MNTRFLVGLVTTLFISSNVACFASTDDSSSKQVRLVAAGIKNARTQMTCAQAIVTLTEHTPKEVFTLLKSTPHPPQGSHKGDEDRVQSCRWYIQKLKLSMMVKPFNEVNMAKDVLSSERIVTDGDRANILERYAVKQAANPKDVRFYYSGVIAPAGSVLTNGLWHYYDEMDPRYYAFYIGIVHSINFSSRMIHLRRLQGM